MSDAEYIPPHPLGFVTIRHPDTNGTADVPPDAVAFYVAHGWEEYEPPTVDELTEARPAAGAKVDQWRDYALRVGVPAAELEAAANKQEVIDLVDGLTGQE